jgi:hypothetical protein
VPRRSRQVAATAGALCALAAALPGVALANDAGSITRTSGPVTATVAWDAAEYGIANPRLSVTRSGVRYDIAIADICREGCIIVPDEATTKVGESALKVADLDGDGEPEILVDTFSGGAHCCVTARLLTWNGSGYATKDLAYGDVSYELRDADADGDGRQELVGYDPRFSAAFTAYAASGFPVQIFHVEDGDVVDVTRRFPKVVAKDAKRNLRDVRGARKGDDVRGVLAAYVADLYTLKQGAKAVRELDRQVARGRVTKAYKKRLLKRLRAWGYR